MEEDEVNSIKKFEDPGMFLIGFKPIEKLKIHHHVRQSCFLYPEEGEVKGKHCSKDLRNICTNVIFSVTLVTLTLMWTTF